MHTDLAIAAASHAAVACDGKLVSLAILLRGYYCLTQENFWGAKQGRECAISSVFVGSLA